MNEGKKYFFCLLSLLLFACSLHAQTWQINGRITDALTREPISYAYVAATGDSAFAFTDNDGNFIINIGSGTKTLAASARGYVTVTIPVSGIKKLHVDFEMTSNASQLKKLANKEGERPVELYVKKIVDNRQVNNALNNKYFSYHSYEKMEFDLTDISDKQRAKKAMQPFAFIFDNADSVTTNGKPYVPLFLSESVSDVYHRTNPVQKIEIVRASKTAGIEKLSLIQVLKDIYRDITLYDDYINVFGKSFISPVSYEGLKHYNYAITDSSVIFGKWCYKITFTADKRFEPTFNGDFWFNDSTFALQRITLSLNKTAMINFVEDFAYVKVFSYAEENRWIPAREHLVVKFANHQDGMSIVGRKTKFFTNTKIDDASSDSVFEKKSYIYMDPLAFDRNKAYWRKNRSEVLTQRESDIYELLDTLKKLPAFQVYVGALIVGLSGYAEIGKINYGPWYNLVSRNNIEGARFRFGGRTNDKFSTKWQLEGYGAYGTKDGKFKYMTGVRYTLQRKPFRAIGFQYKNDYVQPGLNEDYFKDEGWLVIFYKKNPSSKLCKMISRKLYFDAALSSGLSMRVQYLRNEFRQQPESIDFSYYANDAHNEIKNDLNVSELWFNFRYSYQEKFIEKKFKRVSIGSDYPLVQLHFIKGLKNFLGGRFNYAKTGLRVSHDVNFFPVGYMKYSVEAGKVFGTLPYPLLYVHSGNESVVFDYTGFNLMNDYEFVSDQYLSGAMEHHFDGYFFRKLPLIRKLNWREIVSARVLWGHFSKENRELLINAPVSNIKTLPYMEAGVGLENILKLFRVDALWRFNYLSNPDAKHFGIRISAQLLF